MRNTDHEEQIDEQIDAVLRALARQRPPSGMEARVADGVLARMKKRESTRLRWMRLVFAFSTAAAAVIAGVYLAGARRSMDLPAPPQVRYTAGAGASAAAIPAAALTATPGAAHRKRREVRYALGTRALPQESGSDLENRPAPPEPLTVQERILRRVADNRAPHELVAMTPGVEQERSREWRQQYQEFFAPAFRSVAEIEAAWKRTAPEVTAPATTATEPAQTQSR